MCCALIRLLADGAALLTCVAWTDRALASAGADDETEAWWRHGQSVLWGQEQRAEDQRD